MREEGNFSRGSLADQIALYAIYMPILRVEIKSFIQTWNVQQSHRPTAVHGKPYRNYYHPADGVQDQGIPVNQVTFEGLQSAVQDWGIYTPLCLDF